MLPLPVNSGGIWVRKIGQESLKVDILCATSGAQVFILY